MDFLKPEIIAVIVGVVGMCEAIKRAGIKWPTVLTSLVLSIGAGVAAASPLTWQTAIVQTIVVYGGSTLAYELILKRFTSDTSKT